MADEADTNPYINSQANGADTAPQIALISQYVKDLSFENPNAPAVYQWPDQPQIDVQFNIGADRVGEEVMEISLKIDVKAVGPQGTAFAVDLLYAAIFGMRNVPEEQIQPFMLAEAPRLIFPFARRVLADAIRDGGFPPLILDPIDFGALYLQQAQALEQTAGEPAGHA
ncbi:preprotein translocase subunit SecB [Sphingobium xenophagum]|uniref:Protein-export protein SecB n=1 Tax=Sphingobium xenophagum TaxID=121428 RepID=A0ABU1WZG3_SPHXE|nr:protein-export chaperone SecB [Sphingobium xenophagum]MDR7154710.1 preprotein translocase subunit SecB [Sphingobium xenophagum]